MDGPELVDDMALDDDRNLIQAGDKVLLIVEDDPTFARILVDMAHDRGLKAVASLRGGTALSLAREFKPGAITLDIGLPDAAGWTILDRLKHDSQTRHIPVHVISGDENRRRGLALGAMTYLEKAVATDSLAEVFEVIEDSAQTRAKKLLVVSGDTSRRANIRDLLAAPDLEIVTPETRDHAVSLAKEQRFDGIIMEWSAVESNVPQLIEEIQTLFSPRVPPILVLDTRTINAEEGRDLLRLSRTSVVRRAQSLERLLDESVLLLHRAETDLTPAQRGVLEKLRETDAVLCGRTVLVVDDDIRNIFALTSLLESNHLNVVHAENGRAGIELLERTPQIDLVLMDIMMPEMDGYETMQAIREVPKFRSLPIIALTAKAMKGDRAKCLEAGASDYITKPVDLEQLFSVLRVWIGSEEMSQLAAPGA
jgi:CheY-like chemotaxis protein